MLVQHAILADVDRVEQVFDDWVGWSLLTSQLVGLCDELAEVGEGDAAVLLKVELYRNKKKGTAALDIKSKIQI